MVEYLGCCLDANLSGKSMAMKFLRKINTKLQFLHRMLVFIGSLFLTRKSETNYRLLKINVSIFV